MAMRIAILAALMLAVPATANAGDLAGRVYDATALPVAGVVVEVAGREAVTGADGSYNFTGLAEGSHEVAVMLADGAIQRVRADVAVEGTSRRNVFLVSAAALRGARAFAGETAAAPAPPMDAAQLPAGEGAVAAWRWRDNDA